MGKWKQRFKRRRNFLNKPEPNVLQDGVTPTSIFNKIFTSDLLQHLVDMTNLYARRDQGEHSFHVTTTADEMRAWIAHLYYLSGNHPLPRRRLYWENSEDVHVKAMAESMSRNRFEESFFIHVITKI